MRQDMDAAVDAIYVLYEKACDERDEAEAAAKDLREQLADAKARIVDLERELADSLLDRLGIVDSQGTKR